MSTCQAKDSNKQCYEPAIKNSKYCQKHQGYELAVRSKKDTGHGSGDTQDPTGKDQAHNMQDKGSGNARTGGRSGR